MTDVKTVLTLDRVTGMVTEQPVALMQSRRVEIDNANETTWTVEYCWLDCPGQAHKTGMPDSPSHFCDRHIHRSGGVQLKEQLSAAADVGKFT